MPMTAVADCRLARIACEAAITFALETFTRECGADLAGGVKVDLVVKVDGTGEPRRVCEAVRIFATGTSAGTRIAATQTEARIKEALDALTERTGLDLAAVQVFTPPPRPGMLCRAEGVRVDLTV